jgi:hypothetical protein
MPYWAVMRWSWRVGELCRGYKSDPNTETPPKLQDRPATQPRFQPPMTANPGDYRAIVAASENDARKCLTNTKRNKNKRSDVTMERLGEAATKGRKAQ